MAHFGVKQLNKYDTKLSNDPSVYMHLYIYIYIYTAIMMTPQTLLLLLIIIEGAHILGNRIVYNRVAVLCVDHSHARR